MILEFKIEAIKNVKLGVDYLATQEGFIERIKLTDTIVIGVGDDELGSNKIIKRIHCRI